MELVTCDKYYDKVLEKWPELTTRQLDKIVKHGLSSLYLLNLYGGDVLIKNNKFTMYFGKLFKSKLIFYNYWKIKWKIKLRIQYKRAKIKYDGYYYFGLTDEQFKIYQEKTKKIGKRRVMLCFPHIFFHKILEECELNHAYKHFFRMKYPEDCGFCMYKKDYEIRDFEYIYKRTEDNLIEPVSYEQKNYHKYVKRRFK